MTQKARVIMIDNYDSFTYNLVQYLQETGFDVQTLRNDQTRPSEILSRKPAFVVMSPGPSHPQNAGICQDLVKTCLDAAMPLFGVCLGHQCIAAAMGARIVTTAVPMHGKVSDIYHEETRLFHEISSPFVATRYHSLVIDPTSLPPCLKPSATSRDGVIQAIEHETLPIAGVQFHPESVLTEVGKTILRNFARIALPQN